MPNKEIRVKGKLISQDRIRNNGDIDRYCPPKDENYEAEISLPPVDVSKIKEGDEILVKCKLRDVKLSEMVVIAMKHKLEDVVYLFPTAPKEEGYDLDKVCKWLREEYGAIVSLPSAGIQEKSGECECEKPIRMGHDGKLCSAIGCHICHYCNKPIRQKEEKPKIEELNGHYTIANMGSKIDELVRGYELIRNANKE